jgi:hypothetical protein
MKSHERRLPLKPLNSMFTWSSVIMYVKQSIFIHFGVKYLTLNNFKSIIIGETLICTTDFVAKFHVRFSCKSQMTFGVRQESLSIFCTKSQMRFRVRFAVARAWTLNRICGLACDFECDLVSYKLRWCITRAKLRVNGYDSVSDRESHLP